MSGFYVNRLKSPRAKTFAKELEKRMSSPTADENMNSVFLFPNCKSRDLNEVLSAGYAVLRDNPAFFYYRISLDASFDGSNVKLVAPLLYSPEEIAVLRRQLEAKIDSIIKAIPVNSSLWEKERYIFEYLQTHTKYTKDNAKERYNVIGCLLYHQAVCEGISKSFAMLCHRVGIPCIVAFSKSHMWNIVNINGNLANVDATYGTSKPHSICNYTYFNTADADLDDDTYTKELNCIPVCTDISNSFYYRTNSYFFNERELKNYVVRSLLTKKVPIQVKLHNGSIVKVMKTVSSAVPYSFTYSYNEEANTALITLK